MPKLNNRNLMGAMQAINEVATRMYDDVSFRMRVAKTRRLLREQADDVAPVQEQLKIDCALYDGEGKPVMEQSEDGVPPQVKIDPAKYREWNRLNEELLGQEFELPYAFAQAELESGRERISSGRGVKIIPWKVEPWIYDALGSLLNLNGNEDSAEDEGTL